MGTCEPLASQQNECNAVLETRARETAKWRQDFGADPVDTMVVKIYKRLNYVISTFFSVSRISFFMISLLDTNVNNLSPTQLTNLLSEYLRMSM